MKRLLLLTALGSLALFAGGCGATESCGDSQDGNTDNVNRIVFVDNGDDDTAKDNLIVVCENGKMIEGP